MAAVYTYLSPHWLGPKPDQISVGGYNRRGVFWFGLLYWHSLVFIIALRPKTRPSKWAISAEYSVGILGLEGEKKNVTQTKRIIQL